ncbi:MFS transporter [Asanoa sp. WMMD1127]|uniref:MFS transporter n=1 Tax=Asanoa sp. WMMD1127 TaxID=3016107 RepID=UPI0024162572|nr:MFS transporter [Asanoa sp. WMMD1127]MDG4826490.1 MFS transporter [Asanoa sp. WMMD1127]
MGGRARWAITAVFAVNGMLIATMAARAPSVKVDLGLSTGQLGLTTAAFGVAAVMAMQWAGGLVARYGSRSVVRLAVSVLPALLVATAAPDGLVGLAAVFLVFGAVHGVLDVAMNAHAVAVERELGRPILNGCHAAWSIGAVGGSLLASGAAQLGLSRAVHFGVVAAVLTPLIAVWTRALLPAAVDAAAPARQAEPAAHRASTADHPATAGQPAAPAHPATAGQPAAPAQPATAGQAGGEPAPRRPRVPWSRPLVVLGAMGATVLTVEAAVANWSGILLHDRLAAPLGMAALGYVAFTASQTAGRLVGDRLLARRAPHDLLRVGTLTAAAGLALVLVSPWPALAIAGFAVVGIGLATPLPVLFGAAGHLGAAAGGAAGAVARFTTMTYSGILLAPAVIGAVADLVGLTWTLAALVPMLAAVAAVDLRALTTTPAPVTP